MPEWLKRILTSSTTGALSTKRAVMVLASASLCVVFLALGLACAVRIWRKGDIGGGAVAVVLGVGGSVALLAGNAYRKREVGAAAPSAPGGESVENPRVVSTPRAGAPHD